MKEKVLKILKSEPLKNFPARDQKFLASVKFFYESKGFITDNQVSILYQIFERRGKLSSEDSNKPYADLHKKTIRIYNLTFEKVRLVKKLSPKYRKTGNYWSVPLRLENVQTIIDNNIDLSKKLKEWLELNTTTVEDDYIEDEFLNGVLRKYQKIGVNFVRDRNGKALIADDMGLGKTLQALSFLALEPNTLPALVVCPASVKEKWADECRKWTGLSCSVIDGCYDYKNKEEYITPDTDIVIINYDILHVTVGKQTVPRPDVANKKTVILDECHYLKNRDSKRTQAAKQIASSCSFVIGITGTPVESRPFDIWNVLQMVNKEVCPSFWSYVQRYCNAHKTRFGWDFTGAANIQELHKFLTSTIMLRRKKEEVLKELPDKQYSIIPLEWNEKQYELSLKNHETEEVDAVQAKQFSGMIEVEAHKYASAMAKLNSAINWCKDYLDSNGKLVLFTRRVDIINHLMDALKAYNPVKLDGGTSKTNRQKAINIFQDNHNCRVFIGNMKASGTGIDLTAASAVAFVEYGWSPAEHEQCEDRIHRIGQDDSVMIYYLLAKDTIEEKILELLDTKKVIVDSIMDGEQVEDIDLLSELVKEINRRKKK